MQSNANLFLSYSYTRKCKTFYAPTKTSKDFEFIYEICHLRTYLYNVYIYTFLRVLILDLQFDLYARSSAACQNEIRFPTFI